MHKKAINVVTLLFLPIVLILFISTSMSSAKLYKWTDENGNLNITDYPPPVAFEEEEPVPVATPQESYREREPVVRTEPVERPTIIKSTPEPVKTPEVVSTPTAKPTQIVEKPTAAPTPEETAIETPAVVTSQTPISSVDKGQEPVSTPAVQATVQQDIPTVEDTPPIVVTDAQLPQGIPPGLADLPEILTDEKLMNKLGTINTISNFLLLIATILFFYSLYTIAKILNVPLPFLAWVPIINVYILLKSANKPLWWIILLLIPFVNIFIIILIWTSICNRLRIGSNKGLLMIIPFVLHAISIVAIIYFAMDMIATGIDKGAITSIGISTLVGYVGSLLALLLPLYYALLGKRAQKTQNEDDTVKLTESPIGAQLDDTGFGQDAAALGAAGVAGAAMAGVSIGDNDTGIIDGDDSIDDSFKLPSSEEFGMPDRLSNKEEETFSLDTADLEKQIEKAESLGYEGTDQNDDELTLDLDTGDFGIDINADVEAENKSLDEITSEHDIDDMDDMDDTENILIDFDDTTSIQIDDGLDADKSGIDIPADVDDKVEGIDDTTDGELHFDLEGSGLDLALDDDKVSVASTEDSEKSETGDDQSSNVQEGELDFDLDDPGLDVALDGGKVSAASKEDIEEGEISNAIEGELDFDLDDSGLELGMDLGGEEVPIKEEDFDTGSSAQEGELSFDLEESGLELALDGGEEKTMPIGGGDKIEDSESAEAQEEDLGLGIDDSSLDLALDGGEERTMPIGGGDKIEDSESAEAPEDALNLDIDDLGLELASDDDEKAMSTEDSEPADVQEEDLGLGIDDSSLDLALDDGEEITMPIGGGDKIEDSEPADVQEEDLGLGIDDSSLDLALDDGEERTMPIGGGDKIEDSESAEAQEDALNLDIEDLGLELALDDDEKAASAKDNEPVQEGVIDLGIDDSDLDLVLDDGESVEDNSSGTAQVDQVPEGVLPEGDLDFGLEGSGLELASNGYEDETVAFEKIAASDEQQDSGHINDELGLSSEDDFGKEETARAIKSPFGDKEIGKGKKGSLLNVEDIDDVSQLDDLDDDEELTFTMDIDDDEFLDGDSSKQNNDNSKDDKDK